MSSEAEFERRVHSLIVVAALSLQSTRKQKATSSLESPAPMKDCAIDFDQKHWPVFLVFLSLLKCTRKENASGRVAICLASRLNQM